MEVSDPYGLLDPRYHDGCYERVYFARNPGGEWVHTQDGLSQASGGALKLDAKMRKSLEVYGRGKPETRQKLSACCLSCLPTPTISFGGLLFAFFRLGFSISCCALFRCQCAEEAR